MQITEEDAKPQSYQRNYMHCGAGVDVRECCEVTQLDFQYPEAQSTISWRRKHFIHLNCNSCISGQKMHMCDCFLIHTADDLDLLPGLLFSVEASFS